MGIPIVAFAFRRSATSFDAVVSWANILGMSLGALGIVFVVADRIQAKKSGALTSLTDVADQLAIEVLRDGAEQIAHLLGTNDLESHAAAVILTRAARRTASSRSSATRAERVQIGSIADFYVRKTSGRLLISGGPGSGKTVVALRLLVDLHLKRKQSEGLRLADGGLAVPVLFSLPSWQAGDSMNDWFSYELSTRFGLSREIANRLLAANYIVPVLDALDEVDDVGVSTERGRAAVAAINRFLATSPHSRLVLACRNDRQSYRTMVSRLRAFDELSIEALSTESVTNYISIQSSDLELAEWSQILGRLRAGDQDIRLLLSAPWRLAMMVAYQKSGAPLSDLLPSPTELARRQSGGSSSEYISRVDRILYRTFVTSRAQIYGRSPQGVARALRKVAGLMDRHRQSHPSAGTILLHDWDLVVELRTNTRAKMAAVVGIIQLPIGLYRPLSRALPPQEPASPWATGLMFASSLLLLAILTGTALGARKPPMTIGVKGLRNLRIKRSAALAVIVAIAIGFASFFYDEPYGIVAGTSVAVLGIVVILSIPSDLARTQSPRSVLRGDLFAAILFGAAFGSVQTAVTSEVLGLPMAICIGLCWVVSTVITCAAGRYLFAVILSSIYLNRTPIRLLAFFDWCCRAGLMRKSGIGFQFRHKGLERYLLET
ncbi:hypothetical protein AB0J72_00775 [Dactylosporangium sp. NPDC049742]|uniref:NACHT domain-containing protein n=1 Tax=Dactylosporangium sp. NPDC049742 TaxID=3154737 RepID=UPI00343C4164